jgi:hypothetical protein
MRTIEEVIEKLARDRDNTAHRPGYIVGYEDETERAERLAQHEYAKELLTFIQSDSGLVHKGSTQRIQV